MVLMVLYLLNILFFRLSNSFYTRYSDSVYQNEKILLKSKIFSSNSLNLIKLLKKDFFMNLNYDNNDSWISDKQKGIELKMENITLKTEIELKNGVFSKSDWLETSLENRFLKQVLAFEEAEKESEIPIHLLFPSDYQFPPIDTMSENELKEKLDDIGMIFRQNNIELHFSENLPDVLLYQYLTEQIIPKDTIVLQSCPGFIWHLNGCSGDCETCFQKEFCSTAKELDEEEKTEN